MKDNLLFMYLYGKYLVGLVGPYIFYSFTYFGLLDLFDSSVKSVICFSASWYQTLLPPHCFLPLKYIHFFRLEKQRVDCH